MRYGRDSFLERSPVATVDSGQIAEVEGAQVLGLGPVDEVSLKRLVASIQVRYSSCGQAQHRDDQPWPPGVAKGRQQRTRDCRETSPDHQRKAETPVTKLCCCSCCITIEESWKNLAVDYIESICERRVFALLLVRERRPEARVAPQR